MEETIPAEVDPKLQEHCDRLHDEIHNHCERVSFNRLLDNIGERKAFESYRDNHPELFAELARQAPCFTDGKMMEATNKIHRIQTTNYGCLSKSNEAAMASYFFQLHRKMEVVAKKSASMPRNPYGLEGHQSTSIPESRHKADGVFYYARPTSDMAAVHMVMETKLAPAGSTITKDDLGQIADYVHAIWEDQPTRTFVPALFAHGAELDLLVFTRDKWHRAILGPLSYEVQKPHELDVEIIRETMARLWFVSTLPPDRFGHFCDVTKQPSELLLTHMDNSVMATAKVSVGDERSMLLKQCIKRVVHMRGRLAHLLEARYKGEKAVLKMAWAPVDRLPEGAVYEFLDQKNVGGIPKVFDSGILCENVFGYRLEYLVLEHCGDPLDVYLHKLCKGTQDGCQPFDGEIQETVVEIIKQVSSCLVRANDACVLHRDISMGNIAVVNGKATIIDWGYAKIFDNSDGALTPVARRWGFDAGKAMKVEAGHDGLTGTPLYMSIATLYGARRRSLMDDLESVFYVVLHALAQLDTGIHGCLGFTFIYNKNLALVRSALLAQEADVLAHFGVTEPGGHLGEVLHAMYRFLFWSRTGYIGTSLWANKGYERALDLHMAKWFVDMEALAILEQGDSATAGDHGRALDQRLAKWFVDVEALLILEQGDSASAGAHGHMAGPSVSGNLGDTARMHEPSDLREVAGSHAPYYQTNITTPPVCDDMTEIPRLRADRYQRAVAGSRISRPWGNAPRPRKDSRQRVAAGSHTGRQQASASRLRTVDSSTKPAGLHAGGSQEDSAALLSHGGQERAVPAVMASCIRPPTQLAAGQSRLAAPHASSSKKRSTEGETNTPTAKRPRTAYRSRENVH